MFCLPKKKKIGLFWELHCLKLKWITYDMPKIFIKMKLYCVMCTIHKFLSLKIIQIAPATRMVFSRSKRNSTVRVTIASSSTYLPFEQGDNVFRGICSLITSKRPKMFMLFETSYHFVLQNKCLLLLCFYFFAR